MCECLPLSSLLFLLLLSLSPVLCVLCLSFLSVCPTSCFSCFVFSKPDPVCNRFTHCYLAFSSAICFANILPCQRPLKCYNHRAHHLFSFFLLSSYHLNVYQMYVFISFSGWCNYESNVMDTSTLLFQCPANQMSFSFDETWNLKH